MARRRRMGRARQRWANKSWSSTGGFATGTVWTSETGMFSIPILVPQDFDNSGSGQERVTCLRVVGDINMLPIDSEAVLFAFLSLVKLDSDSNTPRAALVSGTNTDPGSPNYFVQQRLLWQYCSFFTGGAGSFRPLHTHIDCRVKTKLEQGSGLYLQGRVTDGSLDADAYVMMNVRALFVD